MLLNWGLYIYKERERERERERFARVSNFFHLFGNPSVTLTSVLFKVEKFVSALRIPLI